jgi:hypothetical protein
MAKKKGMDENTATSIEAYLNHKRLAKIIRENFNSQVNYTF